MEKNLQTLVGLGRRKIETLAQSPIAAGCAEEELIVLVEKIS